MLEKAEIGETASSNNEHEAHLKEIIDAAELNGRNVRVALIHPAKMLRDGQMAAKRKLHCGVEAFGERQVWAVHNAILRTDCVKTTFTAAIKMGSKPTIATT